MGGNYTISGGGCDDSGTAVLQVASAWIIEPSRVPAGSGEEGKGVSGLLLLRTRGYQVLVDFFRVIVCRTCGP
jgi:hypothetical protein